MARRDQPYIPLYVADFLTDEKLRECSAESIGVYIMLMCVLHKQEEYGVILLKQKYKQTDKQVENFACQLVKHLPFTIAEIERALTELIEEDVLQLDGDRLSQKRMVKDALLSEKRASAGKKGGSISQSKKGNFADDFAKAKIQANSEIEIENVNVIENDIKDKKDNIKNSGITGQGQCDAKAEKQKRQAEQFEKFWERYPRKVAKKNAEKAWNKIKLTDELFESIMQALDRQRRSDQWTKDNGQFIPHPATWLNQERWNDAGEVYYGYGRDSYYGNGGAIDGFVPVE